MLQIISVWGIKKSVWSAVFRDGFVRGADLENRAGFGLVGRKAETWERGTNAQILNVPICE